MGKIDYSKFQDSKLSEHYAHAIVKKVHSQKAEIEKFLKQLDPGLNLKKFLLLPFEKLVEYAEIIENAKTNSVITFPGSNSMFELSKLKEVFDYKACLNSVISPFFMKYSSTINIRTCYYCNIDFVNAYLPFKNDYQDFFHFIDIAEYEDLICIKGIEEISAKKIIRLCRGKVKNISDLNRILQHEKTILNKLTAAKSTDDSINFEILKNKKNHYTVDHILPQKDFPCFSLCLFNLLPTCYSCNSKLKKQKLLAKSVSDMLKVSPTSNQYENQYYFKLYYKYGYSKNKLPDSQDKYSIQIEKLNQFSEILQLQGRYNFHKSESLTLINKRAIYSDSQIREISKLLKIDEIEIKSHIFGMDLFAPDSNQPLERYRKDIAKELGLY